MQGLSAKRARPPLPPAALPPAPQGPSAESRAAVQSGKPATPAGVVVLDPEPDVREVLLLADEMQLDEVLAVLCVQTALQEVRWCCWWGWREGVAGRE